MKARPGVTLVEVMLAGVITVLVSLSLMEGIIVAAKVSHENAELLAADAYAWDVAWKWLNKKYEDLPSVTAGQVFSTSSSANKIVIAADDCPELARAKTGGDLAVAVRVTLKKDSSAVSRHGKKVEAKLIEVDVAWGPSGKRKSLNGLAEAGTRTYGHPVSVYKCGIDRGTEDW